LGNSAANSFAATNWNNTATFDENLSYYSFTVGPDAGFNLALTDLSFRVNGSNTLPNNGRWGYSIDAGSFVLGTGGDGGQMTMTLAGGLFSWDFTDFTVNDGSSAEFRFWVFGTTSVNGGTAVVGGSGRILNGSGNDLVLNGTVEAVPEPSTLSLIGFGILGMLAFARRRFSRS
jgi:hypothetical protein